MYFLFFFNISYAYRDGWALDLGKINYFHFLALVTKQNAVLSSTIQNAMSSKVEARTLTSTCWVQCETQNKMLQDKIYGKLQTDCQFKKIRTKDLY